MQETNKGLCHGYFDFGFTELIWGRETKLASSVSESFKNILSGYQNIYGLAFATVTDSIAAPVTRMQNSSNTCLFQVEV